MNVAAKLGFKEINEAAVSIPVIPLLGQPDVSPSSPYLSHLAVLVPIPIFSCVTSDFPSGTISDALLQPGEIRLNTFLLSRK